MQQNSNKKHIAARLLRALTWRLWLTLILIAVAAAAVYKVVHYVSSTSSPATIVKDEKIDLTPTQIRAMEDIGEWEFLAVSDEELIDTTRHGFFGDAELVRIYYGTARLGIDMKEAKPGWIKAEGDSIVAVLPPIRLLDDDFIDEARTRSFIESGTWTHSDREALYQRALATMRKRCLTQANIKSAQTNAGTQFANLLRSMGFSNVSIRFDKQSKKD